MLCSPSLLSLSAVALHNASCVAAHLRLSVSHPLPLSRPLSLPSSLAQSPFALSLYHALTFSLSCPSPLSPSLCPPSLPRPSRPGDCSRPVFHSLLKVNQ
ncbi:hypothetical protein MRB53_028228 [Persea americana]|uniref:Uncharacterized protein n=1 Tax=Persea americana TaxID=3435 RepID=A0ACC2KF07_PERAE|nr:hypothetical protein MRB53_028228 [Persea americana]